jgi:WD40 repeat protein
MSASADSTLKLWSVECETASMTYYGHADAVRAVCAISGNLFLSGSADNTLKLWHCRQLKLDNDVSEDDREIENEDCVDNGDDKSKEVEDLESSVSSTHLAH